MKQTSDRKDKAWKEIFGNAKTIITSILKDNMTLDEIYPTKLSGK